MTKVTREVAATADATAKTTKEAAWAALERANAAHVADVTARLVSVLEKLFTDYVVPDDTLPYRDLIPGIARELTIMARTDQHSPSPSAVNSEIDRVSSALKQVAGLIDDEDIVVTAGDKLQKRRGVRWLSSPLRMRLINIAGQADELARDIEAARPDANMKGRRSRPQKLAATAVAERLYREFERITGRDARRSVRENRNNQREREGGQFVTLVRDVFQILGIDGSPEEAARRAITKARALTKAGTMGSSQD